MHEPSARLQHPLHLDKKRLDVFQVFQHAPRHHEIDACVLKRDARGHVGDDPLVEVRVLPEVLLDDVHADDFRFGPPGEPPRIRTFLSRADLHHRLPGALVDHLRDDSLVVIPDAGLCLREEPVNPFKGTSVELEDGTKHSRDPRQRGQRVMHSPRIVHYHHGLGPVNRKSAGSANPSRVGTERPAGNACFTA